VSYLNRFCVLLSILQSESLVGLIRYCSYTQPLTTN